MAQRIATARTPEITQEAKQKRAFAIWQKAGSPHGRDLEFYYEAEKQLKREQQEDIDD